MTTTLPMIFASVLFMGFTCSMGCGTVNTPFLVGSLLGDGGSVTESRRAIALFSIGKVISLMLMGLFASVFGGIVLSYVEEIYPQATIWLIRIATLLFGAKILYNTIKSDFLPKNGAPTSGCSSCSGCKSKCSSFADVAVSGGGTAVVNGGAVSSANVGFIDVSVVSADRVVQSDVSTDAGAGASGKISKSYFLAGLLYATIPCGPLLTCLTYASTMNFMVAMLLLGLFGIVNSIIPVFLFATLVGMANSEFASQSANFLKYIRLSGGIILVLASIFKVY